MTPVSFTHYNYVLQYQLPVMELLLVSFSLFRSSAGPQVHLSFQLPKGVPLDVAVKTQLIWRNWLTVSPAYRRSANKWLTLSQTVSLPFERTRYNYTGTANANLTVNLVNQPFIFILPLEVTARYDFLKWKFSLRTVVPARFFLVAERYLVRPRYL